MQKKTQLSELIPMKKPVRQSLPVWVNFILEIIVDRLLREFKVEANVGTPQVAYKETIRKNADVEHKYASQSGGKGQYGHVKIKVEPNESGKGYEFINNIVGGAIPKEYIPAVDAGIQGAMQTGVLGRLSMLLTLRLRFMMVLTMKLTLLKWHLRLPVLWHSKKL